jgi:hypothetical protein
MELTHILLGHLQHQLEPIAVTTLVVVEVVDITHLVRHRQQEVLVVAVKHAQEMELQEPHQ